MKLKLFVIPPLFVLASVLLVAAVSAGPAGAAQSDNHDAPAAQGGTATATATCGPAGQWAAATPYPTQVVRYAFVQVGTDFYVISGYTPGAATTAVNKYDVVAGTWTSLAPIPEGSENVVGAYYNGKIYVVQGSFSPSFYIYDIATNTWTTGADEPDDHAGGAAGAYNGHVYFIGGGPGVPSSFTDIYDIATNTWSIGPDAPFSYWLGGFTQVGQYLYLVGSFEVSPSSPWRFGDRFGSLLGGGNPRPQAPASNSTAAMRLDMGGGVWKHRANLDHGASRLRARIRPGEQQALRYGRRQQRGHPLRPLGGSGRVGRVVLARRRVGGIGAGVTYGEAVQPGGLL